MASSNRFTVTITGKKTHARLPAHGHRSDPDRRAGGQRAADHPEPHEQRGRADRGVGGTITGGNRYNIIADRVTLTGTVRTLAKDGPERVKSAMERPSRA